MGSAHTRPHALATRGASGSGLLAAPALVPLVARPADGAAASSASPGEAGPDERIPVVFTWTHGGQNVFLAASFNGWREQIPMVRSGNEFAVVQDLPRGVHQYKFIVDDQWRYAQDQPKTNDNHGNMNNVLDISTYQRFQVGMQDEKEAPKYGQHIPDPNDYTLDAPVIPMVLHKSAFCALPPRPHIPGSQLLSIPNHSLCDHIYLQEQPDDHRPTTLAATHRYGQKYSTTVLATRGPGVAARRPNYLREAVRRRGAVGC